MVGARRSLLSVFSMEMELKTLITGEMDDRVDRAYGKAIGEIPAGVCRLDYLYALWDRVTGVLVGNATEHGLVIRDRLQQDPKDIFDWEGAQ